MLNQHLHRHGIRGKSMSKLILSLSALAVSTNNSSLTYRYDKFNDVHRDLFQAHISGEEVCQFREEEESNDGGTHQSDYHGQKYITLPS